MIRIAPKQPTDAMKEFSHFLRHIGQKELFTNFLHFAQERVMAYLLFLTIPVRCDGNEFDIQQKTISPSTNCLDKTRTSDRIAQCLPNLFNCTIKAMFRVVAAMKW